MNGHSPGAPMKTHKCVPTSESAVTLKVGTLVPWRVREREVSLPGEHTDWCAGWKLSLQSFGHQTPELWGKGRLYMTGGRIWVPVFPASGTEGVVMHEGRDAQCKVWGGGKGER